MLAPCPRAGLTGEVEVEDDPDAVANRGMGRRVLISPVTMEWNPDVPQEVGQILAALPSEAPPKGNKKPIKRLLAVAAAAAIDDLKDAPDKEARETLYSAMDGLLAEHSKKVKEGVEAILTAEIRRVTRSMAGENLDEVMRQEQADDRTVADAFRAGKRALGAAIANGYVRRLAEREAADDEPDIVGVQAKVASLLEIEGTLQEIERRATNLADLWLEELRVPIRGLPEGRQGVYADLREQSTIPQKVDIVLPSSRVEETADKDGEPQPTAPKHVLSDENGQFPTGKLNNLERRVLEAELQRDEVSKSVTSLSRRPTSPLRN